MLFIFFLGRMTHDLVSEKKAMMERAKSRRGRFNLCIIVTSSNFKLGWPRRERMTLKGKL